MLSAVSEAVGRPISPDDGNLTVTATPNTRLLSIHFKDRTPIRAASATEAAAKALIKERTQLLNQQLDAVARSLQTQQDALLNAIGTIDKNDPPGTKGHQRRSAERADLVAQADSISRELTQVESVQVAGGEISDHASTQVASDRWLVAMCSGIMLGLALALLIAFGRHAVSRRVGRDSRAPHLRGLSVLGRLAGTEVEPEEPDGRPRRPGGQLSGQLLTLLDRGGPTDFLSAGRDATAFLAAHRLERAAGRGRHERAAPATPVSSVVLVAGPRDRTRDIERLRSSLEHGGAVVSGVVLVGQIPDG